MEELLRELRGLGQEYDRKDERGILDEISGLVNAGRCAYDAKKEALKKTLLDLNSGLEEIRKAGGEGPGLEELQARTRQLRTEAEMHAAQAQELERKSDALETRWKLADEEERQLLEAELQHETEISHHLPVAMSLARLLFYATNTFFRTENSVRIVCAEKADGDAVTLDAERSAAENADMLWERIEQICV